MTFDVYATRTTVEAVRFTVEADTHDAAVEMARGMVVDDDGLDWYHLNTGEEHVEVDEAT